MACLRAVSIDANLVGFGGGDGAIDANPSAGSVWEWSTMTGIGATSGFDGELADELAIRR